IQRFGNSTGDVHSATLTTYVVQWGNEWTVKRVNVAGSATGTGTLTSHYTQASIGLTVTRDNTWVWGCGWANGDGADGYMNATFTLGDGVNQNTTETQVAVSQRVSGSSYDFDLYVLQHRLASVEYQFSASGNGGEVTHTFTGFDNPEQGAGSEVYGVDGALYAESTEPGRFGVTTAAMNLGGSGTGENWWSALRPVSDTTAEITRSNLGASRDWLAWVQLADVGGVTLDSEGEPAIRVTNYHIGTGDFTLATYDLELLQDLESNYFVMAIGSRGVGGATTQFARVTADPFATGDLGDSGADNVITLTRGSANGEWIGVVTVVECLRSHGIGGFQLVDVLEVTVSGKSVAGGNEVRTPLNAGAAWTDRSRVVPFGGPRGGGVETANANTNTGPSFGAVMEAVGNDEIVLRRPTYVSVDSVDATFTVYVVEWGYDWTVDKVIVDDALTGGGTWDSVELPRSVNPANTWLWASGTSNESNYDGAWYGTGLRLGDGLDTTTQTTLQLAQQGGSHNVYLSVYVLSHPDLDVDWRSVSSTSSDDFDQSVDTPTRSEAYEVAINGVEANSPHRVALLFPTNTSATDGFGGAFVFGIYDEAGVVRLRRNNTDGDVAGYLASIDFAKVEGQTSQTLSYTETGPVQYVILRDPALPLDEGAVLGSFKDTGSAGNPTGVSGAIAQGGGYVGSAVMADGNVGQMVAFSSGTQPASPSEITVQITQGGPRGRAGFSWSLASASASYSGNAPFAFQFANSGNDSTGSDDVAAVTGFYASRSRRVFRVTIADTATDQVDVAYREPVTTGWYEAWTETTFTIERGEFDSTVSQVAGIELPDGTLMLLILLDGDPGHRVVDLYRSTDDGETWTLDQRELGSKIQAVTGGRVNWPNNIETMWLERSGNWLRWLVHASAPGGGSSETLWTFVSSDLGASWTQLSNVTTYPTDTISLHPVALAGVGDESGTFIMAQLQGSGSSTIEYRIASGDADWSLVSDLDYTLPGAPPIPRWMWLVQEGSKVWNFIIAETTGTNTYEMYLRFFDDGEIEDSSSWTSYGQITRWQGFVDGTHPWGGRMFWGAGGIYGIHQNPPGDGLAETFMSWFAGGWDILPLSLTTKDLARGHYYVDSTPLWDSEMFSWGDSPLTSSSTLWTQFTSGTTSTSFDRQYNQLDVVSDASASNYLEMDGSSFAEWGGAGAANARGTLFRFTFQVTTTRDEPSGGVDTGFYFTTKGGHTVQIRIGVTEVGIYDVNAGAFAAGPTATTEFADQLMECRVVFWNDAVDTKCGLWYRPAGAAPTQPWSLISGDIQAGGGATQFLRIGVIGVGSVAESSRTRHSAVQVSNGTDLGTRTDITFPDDLYSMPTDRPPIHMNGGRHVVFG
ncbi:MAG: sialidase family protein, partial [Nitriliruptorales bacterium]|nr:sialidase family protein [Nitriliruptorales bacterium]